MTTDKYMRSTTTVEVTNPTVKDFRVILDRHPDNSSLEVESDYSVDLDEPVTTITIYTDIERPPTPGKQMSISIPGTAAPTASFKNEADNDLQW